MVRKLGQDPSYYNTQMAMLMDLESGAQDNVPADVLGRGLGMMGGFKSSTFDPDTPTIPIVLFIGNCNVKSLRAFFLDEPYL